MFYRKRNKELDFPVQHLEEPKLTRREREGSTSRREFMVKAGALVVASYVSIDKLGAELLWEKTKPEVVTFPNHEAEQRFPDTVTLVIGGFGVPNDRLEGLASAVNDLLSDYGQVAYLENADTGLDMDAIEEEVIRFITTHNVRRLRLYGHSMGGMVATELASRIIDKVDILEAVILDCTPASYKDVKGDGQAGTAFLEATDDLSVHLGPITQDLLQMGVNAKHGQHNLFDLVRRTTKKVINGCSTKLLQDQGRFLRHFNVASYRHRFPESVNFIHLRPEDYAADPTINNKTAVAGWANGLQRTVLDVPIRGSGHADPGSHIKAYLAAIQPIAEKCHFCDQSEQEKG